MEIIEWKVRFISIVDNADTSIESDKKSRQINGFMNEWFLDDLSVNIKRSFKNKREDGHKLIIDFIAAEVVRKIFELYEISISL